MYRRENASWGNDINFGQHRRFYVRLCHLVKSESSDINQNVTLSPMPTSRKLGAIGRKIDHLSSPVFSFDPPLRIRISPDAH